MRWTKSPDQEFTEDNRGWDKGRRRKWTKDTEEKIKSIHTYLDNDLYQFYTGATAIELEWRRRYPDITPPPLRTIGRIMEDLGISGKRKKGRHKGASRYLCYPEHTIYELFGGRVLESDFIGKRYITGRTQPLNFIGFSFKKEPKMRYFRRIEGQTADNFIRESGEFFSKFEKPDFIKVDNGLSVIGSASGKRNISRSMKFLLQNQVIPIFSVPRRPFSQASIEGNNSVFARKFWNRINFTSVEEVDEKLQWFNKSSEQYTRYKKPEIEKRYSKNFIPKVYFIRQVREKKEQTKGAYIDVLNEEIILPRSFINYFVLAQWNLKTQQLVIYFERNQTPEVIKKVPFKINPKSISRCSHFI